MKNGFLRICSMILVIVLLVNMLPLQVLAQEPDTSRVEQNQIEQIKPEEDVSAERVVEEIPQKRTEFSKEFLLENGLHKVNVYPEAVHYATEKGWEEIDNTLITKADGTITNTAGVWDVSFPQQLSKDKSISIQKDGHTLSFYMAGEITSNGSALMRSADTAKETLSVASVKQSAAAIQTPPVQDSVLHEEKIVQKTQSRLTYANVYQNTNVIYDLKSNKVKESVVLEAYNSALRGYRYTLDVGTMIPVLEEDRRIVFYDANRENIVFVMPAPYMIDNGGAYNYDVQVQLTGSGSRYTMTYTLPQQWLAAEDRAWPVILDPEVEPALTTTNIRDRTVVNQGSFSQTWGMNSCGRYSNGDITRTFLKYDNLPELTSSDVIVGATVHMYKPNASSTVTTVYAHKVLGTWASETISWSNKPAYNTTIEDYAIVDGVDWYCWDITDVVRGWYSGANTGVMFKADDEIENGSTANFKEFYSSDYGNNKPVLSITFRNNNGLESYWDYTTASAGRAGTGYVNNYTGNLVWVRQDMGFGGNRMPVSISHVYNAADAYTVGDSNNSNDSAGNGFALGNGWRTNYNQLVYQWSEKSNYYVWEDADGTDHYFEQSASGEYKDEDGLELTLTTTGSGTEKYKITEKNGNISYFDSNGRLSKIQNNQQAKSSITITYESTSRRIKTITDGAGRKYYFEYTAGLLSAIRYMGHGMEELYCTTFEYEGNELICIYDNEAEYSEFEYWDRSILAAATDSQGYALRYYYYILEDDLPSRVCEIHEVQDDYAIAGMLTFEYEHNQTSVTEWLHENGGKTLTYQFNNMGNTICVQDNEGHAQYYKYAINGDETETEQSQPQNAKTNQLRLNSKLQNTVGNMLKDSSFENGTVWDTNASTPVVSVVSTESYFGNYSIQTTTTQSGTGIDENIYTLAPGETVTFSAYVKTGSAAAYLLIYYWTGSAASEQLAPNTNWTRLEATYTNSTSSSQNICPHILTATPGTFWVDGVQMEYAATASRYNLIENGDFRYGGYSWSSSAGIAARDAAAPQLEDTVFTIPGSTTDIRHLIQTVRVSGGESDSFVLSGWAKGNAAPLWKKKTETNQREFALQLFFNYTDGTKSNAFTAQLNPDSNQWQFASVAAVATKAYSSITVQCVYDYNVNRIMFDGIQLFKEEFGTSYAYDTSGNVKSVTNLQKQNTTYEYDTSNNLTGIIESNGNRVSYTYDNYHNVLTANTVDRLVYHFTYDAYGNNTSVYTTVGGVTMATYADYTDDGNQLESATDALGNITTYGYNADTGLLEWVQNPEDTEETRTNYTYDWLLRPEEVYAQTDTGNNMSAYYYYDGDLVSGIQTYSTEYSFNRGDFGLVNSVWAGDYGLAGYEYTDDGNYFLKSLAYGNGGMIHYNYDEKGRLTGESDENGATSTYAYNNDGQLAVVTDSASGITTRYYYDLIGRMVKQVEKGTGYSHTVQQTYNEANNLASLQETINGITHTDTFTYDQENNRVTSVTNSAVSEHYHYDDFGRVDQSTTKNGNSDVLKEIYTFTAPNPNATSGQIATNRLQANGYDVTYSYTYDGNGNILSISDGTYTTSYVYDSANQLLRENNQAGGFTHTWEYDPAGNILNRKEYAYTTGVLGTPIDTVTYSYDDYTWGDLLTAYDGQTIYCDEIGNPIFDGTWDYCWNAGRELCVMIFNGEDGYYLLWEFTYDVNGMRTKRSCEDGTIYQYVYNGSSLSQMTVGTNTLYFAYGANGVPMSVTYNNVTYYYVVNIQGDIIAILNAAGTPVVHYSYDAWGNHLSISGTMASTLGTLNPLRYRGYVYDQETNLYYLQSRYYNPQWGRFINADSVVSGVGGNPLGNNVFAYCFNNPVNMSDSSGNWPKWMGDVVNWITEKVVEPIKKAINTVKQFIQDNVIKYDVPLYDQGNTSSCWAYAQAMIEDYNNGVSRTPQEADARAKQIAVDLNGEQEWDRGAKPKNRTKVEFNSIEELADLLREYGPLYASYGLYKGDRRDSGHAVVVTGVNLITNTVYTNNPWGRKGRQSYSQFKKTFVGEREVGWKLDACYYLF